MLCNWGRCIWCHRRITSTLRDLPLELGSNSIPLLMPTFIRRLNLASATPSSSHLQPGRRRARCPLGRDKPSPAPRPRRCCYGHHHIVFVPTSPSSPASLSPRQQGCITLPTSSHTTKEGAVWVFYADMAPKDGRGTGKICAVAGRWRSPEKR